MVSNDTVYVVRDGSGEYIRNAETDRRTPASNEAQEFETRGEAETACTRATDRVLSREVE
jgi:phosphatidate phosphatase APP1